jgi:hypothetical protein
MSTRAPETQCMKNAMRECAYAIARYWLSENEFTKHAGIATPPSLYAV